MRSEDMKLITCSLCNIQFCFPRNRFHQFLRWRANKHPETKIKERRKYKKEVEVTAAPNSERKSICLLLEGRKSEVSFINETWGKYEKQ